VTTISGYKILESISTITEMIIGKLNIASIQDLKTGEINDYLYKHLKDIVYSLDNKETLIFLYSEDFKKGSLSLRYEGNYWALCISFNS
jgi:glutamine cyclotransferase